MEEIHTFVTLQYDILAFDEQEIESLKEIISELGPVRSREAYKGRGGVETTLWIVLSFIGGSFLSGFLNQAGANSFDKIISIINKFYSKPRQENPEYMQAIALQLSYDEIDIEINLPGKVQPQFLQPILEEVWTHLNRLPLSESYITKIYIPFIFDEEMGGWWESFVPFDVDFNSRYWGVHRGRSPYVDDIYDSYEGRLLNVPYDQIMSNR
jgi:hypothetical protein